MNSSSTLKIVAEKLGVSVSTVSRAVNNKKYVKKETKEEILQALKEYNYVPNGIARSLKMQESKTIGVVLPDICELFFGKILKGIDAVVAPKGYSLIVADTNEKKENESKYLDILYQKRVDALVLATVNLRDKKIEKYLNNNIPVVFIDNIPCIGRQVDSVTIDNIKASRIAVDCLIREGHRRIALIAGSLDETTGYDRVFGYREALLTAGIQLDHSLIAYGDYKERSGFDSMQRLLEQHQNSPFTAVYVTSEMMTFGAIKAIRDRGLNIPDDLSIIGFDIHDKAGLVYPIITTIHQPEMLIGQRTAELLLRRMAGEPWNDEQRAETLLLEPVLLEGQSIRTLSIRKGLQCI